jgi:hypothetical protein
MARAMNAGSRAGNEHPQSIRPITPVEVASSTWDSLPTVKTESVVLEVKPLFVISGGKR